MNQQWYVASPPPPPTLLRLDDSGGGGTQTLAVATLHIRPLTQPSPESAFGTTCEVDEDGDGEALAPFSRLGTSGRWGAIPDGSGCRSAPAGLHVRRPPKVVARRRICPGRLDLVGSAGYQAVTGRRFLPLLVTGGSAAPWSR
jgi:hypothetical protein